MKQMHQLIDEIWTIHIWLSWLIFTFTSDELYKNELFLYMFLPFKETINVGKI